MFLDALPLVFVLIGLILYTVLGGADFGAGAWRLLSGPGPAGSRIRDHAHHSMGPVWEANHVWLIFVLTVTWTAYPTLLGSLASTLAVPLFLAGLGIIVRGASYALRSAASGDRELSRIDTLFGVASLITPFMLGTAVGAIAAQRVPVGNAAGKLISSWTGPVSVLIGALAVVFSAYLAAVFLAADAARHEHDPELTEAMRSRALAAGAIAGGLSVAGLVVIHGDARPLYHGLIYGSGLVPLLVSCIAGAATLGLVALRRFEAARYGAAVAVAAVVAGWAAARWPSLLPHLTIWQAAAPHDTLICVVVAVLAGGVLLFPALGLLFSLTLRGELRKGHIEDRLRRVAPEHVLISPALGARVSVGLLIVGVGLLNAANAPWAHVIGVVSLFGFLVVAFMAVVGQALGESDR